MPQKVLERPIVSATFNDTWRITNPKPGETYLQIAALHPQNTERYLPELQAKGLRAIVVPGPEQGIYRVLIGPLRDHVSLEQQRRALHAAGVESILRVYGNVASSPGDPFAVAAVKR